MVAIKENGIRFSYPWKNIRKSIQFPRIKISIIFQTIFRLIFFIFDIITLPIHLPIQKPWKQWMKMSRIRSKGNYKIEYIETPSSISNHSTISNQTSMSNHSKNIKVWTKVWPSSELSRYENCSTINEMIKSVMIDHSDQKLFGYRKIIREIDSFSNDGKKKVCKKVLDEKYTWMSYREVDARIDGVINGLINKGVNYQDKIVIILETRHEWMMIAQSVFRMGGVLCTLYDTLGINGIIHAINELECAHVICNQQMALTLSRIKDRIPKVTCLIVVGSCGQKLDQKSSDPNLDIVSLDQLERFPIKRVVNQRKEPCPTDLAMIMYTSGTTGTPKGVMFNQGQFVHMYKGWNGLFNDWNLGNAPMYQAYLPLAHIFEFLIETVCILRGIPIGFSSPMTIFDHSPGLGGGIKGDVSILKPTLIIAVPLILERIRAQIKTKVIKTEVIRTEAIKTKLINITNYIYSSLLFPSLVQHSSFWTRMGMKSPLISRLINENSSILGGNVKTVLTGSAPVSQELIDFIQSTLDCDVILNYATTESMGVGCSMDRFGSSCFNSSTGSPMIGSKISLIDWKDGNYSPNDEPNPRGELLIGCESVSLGYFKKPIETEEAFFLSEMVPVGSDVSKIRSKRRKKSRKSKVSKVTSSNDGQVIRWLRTGDIAEIDSKYGVIRIIDRKKDLVKLSNGQFVSLTKIELCLKRNRFIENICVAADPKCHFLVCIILPNRENFMNLVHNSVINDDDDGLPYKGSNLNTNYKSNYKSNDSKIISVSREINEEKIIAFSQDICNDYIIRQLILESIKETGREGGLNPIEIPVDTFLTAEEWNPSNGLVTASLKLRRKQVTDHYRTEIDHMYSNYKERSVFC